MFPVIQLILIGWPLVQVPLCANFIAYFWAPYSPPRFLRFQGFLWVFMGFHGFLEVVITSNLGGPVGGLVGWVRFQEVSGGYNLQNRAWTFADAHTCAVCAQWQWRPLTTTPMPMSPMWKTHSSIIPLRSATTSINKEVQEVLEHAKVQGPHPWFLPSHPPFAMG